MRYFLMVLGLVLLVSCNSGKKEVPGETQFQKDMNALFKDASKSPLTSKDLKKFEALDFFPFDSIYVVKATFIRTPESQPFRMKTTTDRMPEYVRYGVVSFELHGEKFQLNAYKGIDEEDDSRLFIPFLDDTNGEDTYGGGRYIDLDLPSDKNMMIDFNQAYNPYCVYNENYSCPIVPRENYLPVRVEAGLKKFSIN
ncbi:DUF1684 domain-containing protein [Aegicerativicinus sediminis]